MMGVYSELYIDFIENYPQLIEGRNLTLCLICLLR